MRKDRVYHTDPDILGGALVFKGTRVPVRSFLDHMQAGSSVATFRRGFPGVKREQVLAVLEESKEERRSLVPR